MSNNIRAELESQYKVENGVIRSPGKFEGEPLWVAYFWAMALEGGGHTWDDNGTDVTTFMIQSGDVALFPELDQLGYDGGAAVSVLERDDGFVMHSITTGPDECFECHERFTARASNPAAICPLCQSFSRG